MSWVELSTNEELDAAAGWPGSSAARLSGPAGTQGVGDVGTGLAERDERPDAEGLAEADGFVVGACGAGWDDEGEADGDGDGEAAPGSAFFWSLPVSLFQMSTMPPTMSVTMLPPWSVDDGEADGEADG